MTIWRERYFIFIIRYECTIDGCEKFDGEEGESLDDVIVVQRETQTVRAVEPRSGQEKWNFSVSQGWVPKSSFVRYDIGFDLDFAVLYTHIVTNCA